MAKYDPLETYLKRRGGAELQLSFADIERIVGAMLPNSATRPQWWANETDPASSHVQCRAWRNAGYDAFLLPGERVPVQSARCVLTMADPPQTTCVTPEDLTEEQLAEGRRALESLIKIMARATVDACDRLGIEFDMDDPEVARDVMKATFDRLFLSPPTRNPGRSKRAAST